MDALQHLDMIEYRLRSPRRWGKHQGYKKRFLRPDQECEGHAITAAAKQGGEHANGPAYPFILMAIRERGYESVPDFNDAPVTTYSDVMWSLRKARQLYKTSLVPAVTSVKVGDPHDVRLLAATVSAVGVFVIAGFSSLAL